MQHRFLLPLAVILALAPAVSAADGQHALTLPDMLAWKRIQAPAISANGEWFAYRLAPAEVNAEVVIRNLKSGKELRFPVGDAGESVPAPAGAPAPAAAPVPFG